MKAWINYKNGQDLYTIEGDDLTDTTTPQPGAIRLDWTNPDTGEAEFYRSETALDLRSNVELNPIPGHCPAIYLLPIRWGWYDYRFGGRWHYRDYLVQMNSYRAPVESPITEIILSWSSKTDTSDPNTFSVSFSGGSRQWYHPGSFRSPMCYWKLADSDFYRWAVLSHGARNRYIRYLMAEWEPLRRKDGQPDHCAFNYALSIDAFDGANWNEAARYTYDHEPGNVAKSEEPGDCLLQIFDNSELKHQRLFADVCPVVTYSECPPGETWDAAQQCCCPDCFCELISLVRRISRKIR